MNEFIVWDNKFEKFIEPSYEIVMTTKDALLKGIQGGHGFVEEWEAFNYIGKTDINDKKIYADCSIFEFDLGLYSKRRKGLGYFQWNEDLLRYEILVINSNEAKCEPLLEFNPFLQGKFNIIGTIQQDKHLLGVG